MKDLDNNTEYGPGTNKTDSSSTGTPLSIKELRQSLNLTQKEFAKLTHIPQDTIAKWEQGLRTPPAYVPYLIQQAFSNEAQLNCQRYKSILSSAVTLLYNTSIVAGSCLNSNYKKADGSKEDFKELDKILEECEQKMEHFHRDIVNRPIREQKEQ